MGLAEEKGGTRNKGLQGGPDLQGSSLAFWNLCLQPSHCQECKFRRDRPPPRGTSAIRVHTHLLGGGTALSPSGPVWVTPDTCACGT